MKVRTNRWAKGTARNELNEIFDVSYVAEDRLVVYGRITTQVFNDSLQEIVVSVSSSSRAYRQRQYFRKSDLSVSLAYKLMLHKIELHSLLFSRMAPVFIMTASRPKSDGSCSKAKLLGIILYWDFSVLFSIGVGCAIFLIANACCPRNESPRSTPDPSNEPFIAPTDQAVPDLHTVASSASDAKSS